MKETKSLFWVAVTELKSSYPQWGNHTTYYVYSLWHLNLNYLTATQSSSVLVDASSVAIPQGVRVDVGVHISRFPHVANHDFLAYSLFRSSTRKKKKDSHDT